MLGRIAHDGLTRSTTIILSAKHGQSPRDPRTLRRVDDGAIIDAINASWKQHHPSAAPLVAFSVDDDGMLLWLSDRSATALAFVKHYLLEHTAPANRINDPAGSHPVTVASSGLTSVRTGTAADALVGAKPNDSRTPDVIGLAQHGVVYTGGVKKIAEHGGGAADDRDVALVVWGAGAHHGTSHAAVTTTQIAPTILALLGLQPHALQAVRMEHTSVLPAP